MFIFFLTILVIRDNIGFFLGKVIVFYMIFVKVYFKLKVYFFLCNLEFMKVMKLLWGISIIFKDCVKFSGYLYGYCIYILVREV